MRAARIIRTALAPALLAAAASPAFAQAGNPAGTKPASAEAAPGKPAPHEPNTQDRLFVQLVGAGGLAEVDAARLAASRAHGDAVKAFAQRMASEHAGANERLATLARQAAIPVPSALDPDHQAMRQELQAAPDARFDAAYLHAQLIEHQKTLHLLEWEMGNGQDPELVRYASATLPTVVDHLLAVQQLLAATSGAPPQGLAAAQGAGRR